MRPQFTSASCPNCNTYYDRVPVEYDEDGSYAVLEVYPCADPKGLLNNNLYKTEVMRYVVGSGPPFQSGCQAGRR